MRLIDADALRKSIEQDRDASDMPKMWYEGIEYAISHIIHAPTIEERKAGRWITHKIKLNGVYHSYCECTACGHTRPTTLFPLYYCPNCGARMEGEPE